MAENEKFQIILADPTTMADLFPLEMQQFLVKRSEIPLFFAQSQEQIIMPSDIAAQVNEYNRENIDAILLFGFISSQISDRDLENSATFGVPVINEKTTRV